ncbi:P-type Ca2+ transporter type 2C [Spiroplasma sp. TIUS-1]|uniref:cation-translocating P-type ATPase n=1 Tax=Spiroplasma sp. TIUS-1 TaxID=216963 RepID=UPI001396F3D1|nr:HAD-IC family P-type ATPase [Spiroplasma sp. TIUS-1]QHX35935.1 P-type Ca2+ transporter type 2C [Spiroplasma sp. TIUS-1]
MEPYPSSLTPEDVVKKYKSNPDKGLSQDELAVNIERFGKNQIKQKKPKSPWVIFFHTLIEPIQLILVFAAFVSLVAPIMSAANGHVDYTEFIDFIVIIAIVFIDGTMQTIQGIKAEKSVEALNSLTKPKCLVIRDGNQLEIESSELTIGDIVILEAGRYIPADLRILDSSNLMIDESNLTGESVPVEKNHFALASNSKILGELSNIAFMSTFITNGRATGIVVKIGDETEIGKISKMISETKKEKTMLEQKINKFSIVVAGASIIVGILFFVTLMIVSPDSGNNEGLEWLSHLMVALTLAIGLIPECLGAAVSIALSISTKRMVKNNMIVKKLSVVEALGGVNVICTDKTGTLTQNKMTCEKIIYKGQIINSDDWLTRINESEQAIRMTQGIILCNDSVIQNGEKIGDPTELAFVEYAHLMGHNEVEVRNKYKRLSEIPFDSSRKRMTTVNKIGNEKFAFTKGGVEQVLEICTHIYEDNKIKPITKNDIETIMTMTRELSKKTLRVMAFASKVVSTIDTNGLEQGFVFQGAIGMKDPVRKAAVETVALAYKKGVKVVMITGDHPETALAIAQELGLANSEKQVMTSVELESMSDFELLEVIDHIRVFARVNPEHKVKIVSLLQRKGYITSMTGDGVNDAPSLAAANVGVAMGITGTDVAKQAADAILTDDNLFTIINGIKEGRGVYKRIQKAIAFVMGVNISNIIAMGLIILISSMSPLEAINILWINLVIETMLATTIGMGLTEETDQKIQLKNKSSLFEGIWGMFIRIIIINTITVVSAFYIAGVVAKDVQDPELFNKFRTTAMFFVAMTSPALFVNTMRITTWNGANKFGYTSNTPLMISSALALLLNLMIILTPGVSSTMFGLIGISDYQSHPMIILVMIGLAFLPMLIMLVSDCVLYIIQKHFPNRWDRNQRLSKLIIEDEKESTEIQI